MKKAKTLSERQFNALSNKEQAKELKRMAKRSNVRLSLLEETGNTNQIVYEAQDYNLGNGRLKNRFYEGTKYKTNTDIKEAYTALSNFLNNKKSTLGGINTEAQQKAKDLMDKGQFDYYTLKKLTDKEKLYIAKEASKKANKQLGQLEKAHIDKFAYEVADQYNKGTGRPKNRFYTGGKFKNDKDLNVHIQNIFHFLNSKTATPKGYRQMNDERINSFREKGVDIKKGQEADFYDFLSSEQFKALSKYADSDQVIETYVDARNAGEDSDKINRAFQDFMNSNMTFDEVQEALKVAKYQKGGLLK